jgi:uncharacterized protein (TIRG00374 family)
MKLMAHSSSAHVRVDRRRLWLLLLAVIVSYAVIPQLSIFHHSLSLLAQVRLADVWPAIGSVALTYLAAAGTYCLLAFTALPYGRTLLVQVAGMFVNRLLPAGIGGIGVNYVYLRRQDHSGPQAASVVTANNVLGIVGHGLLLAILLPIFHSSLPSLHWRLASGIWVTASAAIFLMCLGALVFLGRYRRRLKAPLLSFLAQLSSFRQRPGRLGTALLCSMALTLCNILCLWFCVSAVTGGISFVTAFLVFSFGIALGTATPTPGGLGGVEAGLVAGLVAYQLSSADALAAVLLFRLVSYWLPLLIGAAAFTVGQRRHYFSAS